MVPRDAAPLVDLPAEKKRRIYFVDKAAVQSERAHAMIVEYRADTVTTMHPRLFRCGRLRFLCRGRRLRFVSSRIGLPSHARSWK